MIVRQNLHTHTQFCDGRNTAEEMIKAAVSKGMTSVGFSGHAFTEHDTSYCMSQISTNEYKSEIEYLKEKYSTSIKVYIGIEQDYYSVKPIIKYDYIIGSVHYVCKDGVYTPVDETKDILIQCIEKQYNGDVYSFLEDYYKTEADIYNRTACDIVGHFDLPEKFNADNKFFDRKKPRYIEAYRNAVDILISQNRIFEINTGAIARGYTHTPYPNPDILKYIASSNGKVTVSSDCHNAELIDYKLNEMCLLAKQCGFNEVYFLTENGFKPYKL